MNVLETMQSMAYIKNKQVSLYLSNYNGADAEKVKKAKLQYRLPDSFIRFGSYDATGLLKSDKSYFWTVTSQYNWTLDLYGIQYGHSLIDLNAVVTDNRPPDMVPTSTGGYGGGYGGGYVPSEM
jgi:hypothetical protein